MINAGPPKGLEAIGKFVRNRLIEVSQDKYARYYCL
jgi:pumilio RNA-binding family